MKVSLFLTGLLCVLVLVSCAGNLGGEASKMTTANRQLLDNTGNTDVGFVNVQSTPDHALVYTLQYTGTGATPTRIYRGQTPLTLRLAPGTYTIRVELTGYTPYEEKVVVRPQARYDIRARLVLENESNESIGVPPVITQFVVNPSGPTQQANSFVIVRATDVDGDLTRVYAQVSFNGEVWQMIAINQCLPNNGSDCGVFPNHVRSQYGNYLYRGMAQDVRMHIVYSDNVAVNYTNQSNAWCNDTDDGVYEVAGTCTDSAGNVLADTCVSGSDLREAYCSGTMCQYTQDYNCGYGYHCAAGACVSNQSQGVLLYVGQSVDVGSHTVQLINVGSGSPIVVVNVSGVQETVSGSELVNGVYVVVLETFYSENLSDRSARLLLTEINMSGTFMMVNQTENVSEHLVRLINVGSGQESNTVVVSVDGTYHTITGTGTFNDVRIDVIQTIYTDIVAYRAAVLVLTLNQSQESCLDSDGGLNYFTYGGVSGWNGSEYANYDYCGGGSNIWEWYCNGTSPEIYFTTCPYGCSGGACLGQPPNTAPTATIFVNPQGQTTMNWSFVNVSARDIEGNMSLITLEQRFNGGSWSTVVQISCSGGEYCNVQDQVVLRPISGYYEYRAIATDVQGLNGTSNVIWVNYTPATAPVVQLFNVTPSGLVHVLPSNITSRVYDADGNLRGAALQVRFNNGAWTTPTTRACSGSYCWLNYTHYRSGYGRYEYRLYANDTTNMVAYSSIVVVNYTLANLPPNITSFTVIPSGETSQNWSNITVVAYDANGNLNALEVYMLRNGVYQPQAFYQACSGSTCTLNVVHVRNTTGNYSYYANTSDTTFLTAWTGPINVYYG